MSNPWFKFWPQDWRGDQGLRVASLAARGLWIEMLAIMHEAKPYGHLLHNGIPVDGEMLAKMVSGERSEISALLSELENLGVFSRNRKGVVFSRRMVKDYARAEKGRKSVKKRWEQDAENKPEKPRPNRYPTRKAATQKPEARDSVSNDTGFQPTIADRLWSDGLGYLQRAGIPERQARSLIGRWRKALGGSGGGDMQLLALIGECQARGISEPGAYIEAAINKQSDPDRKRQEFVRAKYGS